MKIFRRPMHDEVTEDMAETIAGAFDESYQSEDETTVMIDGRKFDIQIHEVV